MPIVVISPARLLATKPCVNTIESSDIFGIIVGAVISKIGETHPVDLSMWAEGYQALGYDAYVYTTLQPVLVINVAILVIITGVLAALYPAYKALKNDPADALRIE